jgi:hypothetical protein
MTTNEQIIELVKAGMGVQAVADHLGLKRHKVEYVKKSHGMQGMYRKTPERKTYTPTQTELLQEYDYLGFETTERGTIICTIGDVSGDEKRYIKDAVRSAYEKIIKEDHS